MAGDNICLLVQRAGITQEFRLRGPTIHFGYAPGGKHDLVLYDSMLDDVQGTIEYQAGAPDDGYTPYRLRARSPGIEVEGVNLPPREAVSIRLRLDQRIKVGRYYQLTVSTYDAGDGKQLDQATAAPAHRARIQSWPVPFALQDYMAESRLFLNHLPEIYRSDEVASADARSLLTGLLALLESVFLPLRWTVQNYDLALQPVSAPPELLSWLADWYGLPMRIDFLTEGTQRALLSGLHDLLARKGTFAGLCDLLILYTGVTPEVEDQVASNLFTVALATKPPWWEQYQAEVVKLIEWYKPAHTSFILK
jgi:phage tail-like protein